MKNLITLLALLIFSINVSKAQWIEFVNTGVTCELNSISSPYNSICWCSGDSGVVLRTTNGGVNWQNVGGGIFGVNDIHNMFAVDANIAFVSLKIGTNAHVYRTTNGGVSWIQVFSQVNGFINSVWMTSTSNGFMMGDPVGGRWSLWKTTNGGVTWDSSGLRLNQIGGETGWINGMFVLNDQIWFSTFSTRLYYSSNFGANWSIQYTTLSTGYATVWFNNPINGMSSGFDIAYTSNSGVTWIPRNLQNNFIIGIMGYGNYFWECEANLPSRIQMTSNRGLNWIVEYIPPSPYQLNHITASRNGDIGWACMTYGIIAKRTVPLSITYYNNEIPTSFSLFQNYPNPFNPVTSIKFDVSQKSNVKIKIYDMLGKEVSILVNEELDGGSYNVEWDGSNFSSGVYFYNLVTDKFVDVKKMVLIK